jgi:hypothetical protein
MTKILGLCFVVVLVGCSKSNSTSDMASNTAFCQAMDDISATIMFNRQLGVPMAEMIKTADTSDDEQVKEAIQAIIKDAYLISRYEAKENQEKAITDFRNKVYLACIN